MASQLPIPAPPRTPTPPSEDERQGIDGLGLDGVITSPTEVAFDPRALSPMREHFMSGRYGSLSNPLSPGTPTSFYSALSNDSAGSQSTASMEDGRGPFNFQPMSLSKTPITKSVRL